MFLVIYPPFAALATRHEDYFQNNLAKFTSVAHQRSLTTEGAPPSSHSLLWCSTGSDQYEWFSFWFPSCVTRDGRHSTLCCFGVPCSLSDPCQMSLSQTGLLLTRCLLPGHRVMKLRSWQTDSQRDSQSTTRHSTGTNKHYKYTP